MRLTREQAFGILGVTESADETTIKKAYRRLAMQWHPDKNQDPEATQRFQQINAAYKKLTTLEDADDEDVDIDEDAAFEFFMYMMSQMFNRPTPFGGMRGMYCRRPGCSCGNGPPQRVYSMYSEDESDGYDDDSGSWITDDGDDDEDEEGYSWQDARRSQERRRKAQEDKQTKYENMLKREAALKEERKQKWLRQLPRPTMTARTENSLSVCVERKGRSSEFADPHLPDSCQWELEYRGMADVHWHAVRVPGTESTATAEGLQPGSKYRLRARACAVGDDGSVEWGEYSVESQYVTAGRSATEPSANESATGPTLQKKGKKKVDTEAEDGNQAADGNQCERAQKGKSKAQSSNQPTRTELTAEEIRKKKADAEREASMKRAVEAAAAEYEAEVQAAKTAQQRDATAAAIAAGAGAPKKKKHKNKAKKRVDVKEGGGGQCNGWGSTSSTGATPSSSAPPTNAFHTNSSHSPYGNGFSSRPTPVPPTTYGGNANGSTLLDEEALAVEEAIQLAMVLEESRKTYELEQARYGEIDERDWEANFPTLPSGHPRPAGSSKNNQTAPKPSHEGYGPGSYPPPPPPPKKLHTSAPPPHDFPQPPPPPPRKPPTMTQEPMPNGVLHDTPPPPSAPRTAYHTSVPHTSQGGSHQTGPGLGGNSKQAATQGMQPHSLQHVSSSQPQYAPPIANQSNHGPLYTPSFTSISRDGNGPGGFDQAAKQAEQAFVAPASTAYKPTSMHEGAPGAPMVAAANVPSSLRQAYTPNSVAANPQAKYGAAAASYPTPSVAKKPYNPAKTMQPMGATYARGGTANGQLSNSGGVPGAPAVAPPGQPAAAFVTASHDALPYGGYGVAHGAHAGVPIVGYSSSSTAMLLLSSSPLSSQNPPLAASVGFPTSVNGVASVGFPTPVNGVAAHSSMYTAVDPLAYGSSGSLGGSFSTAASSVPNTWNINGGSLSSSSITGLSYYDSLASSSALHNTTAPMMANLNGTGVSSGSTGIANGVGANGGHTSGASGLAAAFTDPSANGSYLRSFLAPGNVGSLAPTSAPPTNTVAPGSGLFAQEPFLIDNRGPAQRAFTSNAYDYSLFASEGNGTGPTGGSRSGTTEITKLVEELDSLSMNKTPVVPRSSDSLMYGLSHANEGSAGYGMLPSLSNSYLTGGISLGCGPASNSGFPVNAAGSGVGSARPLNVGAHGGIVSIPQQPTQDLHEMLPHLFPLES